MGAGDMKFRSERHAMLILRSHARMRLLQLLHRTRPSRRSAKATMLNGVTMPAPAPWRMEVGVRLSLGRHSLIKRLLLGRQLLGVGPAGAAELHQLARSEGPVFSEEHGADDGAGHSLGLVLGQLWLLLLYCSDGAVCCCCVVAAAAVVAAR